MNFLQPSMNLLILSVKENVLCLCCFGKDGCSGLFVRFVVLDISMTDPVCMVYCNLTALMDVLNPLDMTIILSNEKPSFNSNTLILTQIVAVTTECSYHSIWSDFGCQLEALQSSQWSKSHSWSCLSEYCCPYTDCRQALSCSTGFAFALSGLRHLIFDQ